MFKSNGLRIIGVAVVAFVLFSFSSNTSLAQSRSVEVTHRDGDITIDTNGDMHFNETWVVKFIGGPFHNAFRCIQQGRYKDITDWAVGQSGEAYVESGSNNPGTYELYNDNNQDCIKWYFPTANSVTRTFNLQYTIQGGLRIYSDGDLFNWIFIESDRQYTIDASTVTLHIPGNATPNQVTASAAENLAENSKEARVVDGKTVVFTGSNFTSGDQWNLIAKFPHGIVQAQPAAWQTAEDAKDAVAPFLNFGLLILSLVVLIGGGLGLYLLWYTRGRDRPTGVVAEFYPTPPTDDPPGLVGTLIDERADMQDIVATIVDLARRGVLRMEEKQEAGFLGIGTTHNFTFERVGAATGLRPYEQTIIQKLFGSSDSRDLDDLKEKFYKYLPDIKKQLYQATISAGYFQEDPQSARTRYSVLGVVALVVLGCIGFVIVGQFSDTTAVAICPLIAFGLVGAAFVILGQFMPKRTDAGATAAAKWNAFKRYLANIEKYTKVEDAKDQFDKYLPYAIAFGLEHSWVNKFSAVDTPAPAWYYPYGYYGGFGQHYHGGVLGAGMGGGPGGGGHGLPNLNEASAGAFRGLNSMSDGLFSMLNATASTFSSVPHSSGGGGFGGGGFSGGGGGGFGGGGGGGGSGFG